MQAEPTLRTLRIFEAVAQLGSIHKAAQAVRISQPAVTLAIKNLEPWSGVSLFVRSTSGTRLTDPGNILLARVGQLFSQIESALAELDGDLPRSSLPSVAGRISRPHLAVLSAIAEERPVSGAAQRIGVSKSTFLRSLRELERTIGASLVVFTANGFTITSKGETFARRVILALREIDWAVEEINLHSGRLGGQLRVGVRPLAGNFLLAPVINDLKKLFPAAFIQIRSGDGNHLTRSLLTGEVDFVVGMIGTPGDEKELTQEPLVSSPYVVVARKGHPLVEKARITEADLAAFEWIAPLAGATRRTAFDGLFCHVHRASGADIETYSLSTIRLLLMGSDRLTLMTRFEFEFECGRDEASLICLSYGPIEPVHTVGITRRIKGMPTPLQTKFLALMRQHARTLHGSVDAGEISRVGRNATGSSTCS